MTWFRFAGFLANRLIKKKNIENHKLALVGTVFACNVGALSFSVIAIC
jgi:hypothetical protein